MSTPYREFHDNDKVGSACTGAPGRRALQGGDGVRAGDENKGGERDESKNSWNGIYH